jgi:hypothetical protein
LIWIFTILDDSSCTLKIDYNQYFITLSSPLWGYFLVAALNEGELHIFTHPNYRPVVQQQFGAIDAAFERAAQRPLGQHIVNQKLDML